MNTDTPIPESGEIDDALPFENLLDERFIESLEKAVQHYHRYLKICLSLTTTEDWICHKETYSLQASGAEKLCNVFGITWSAPLVVEHKMKDEEGDFYEYEVSGTISSTLLKRRDVWFTGNRSSRDSFFQARSGGFDKGDIRKAAFSNWLVNAVARLIGLRNPSVEMLREAGLNPDKIRGIDYSGKPEEPITSKQNGRLWVILRDKKLTKADLLTILSEFGIDDTRKIKRGDYDKIIKKIEQATSQSQQQTQPQQGKSTSTPPPQQKPPEQAQGPLIHCVATVRLVAAGKAGEVSTILAEIQNGQRKETIRLSFRDPVGDLVGLENLQSLRGKIAWFSYEMIVHNGRDFAVIRAFSLSEPAQNSQASNPPSQVGEEILRTLQTRIQEAGLQDEEVSLFCKAHINKSIVELTEEEIIELLDVIASGDVAQWIFDAHQDLNQDTPKED